MEHKVVIIGQGYVGLPIAMRAVEVGYQVVGLDSDGGRIRRLQDGDSFVEDVPNDKLRAALASGRYVATTNSQSASGFDVAVITVPTPLRESVPDLSFIEQASTELSQHIRTGSLVVLESTTYPGTTEELVTPILEAGSKLKAGQDFYVGYSPERIDPGNPTWSFHNTPKVVAGLNAPSLTAAVDFYGSLVEQVVPVSGCREAELTKLLENTFRHVNIALVNELAVFAKQLDINVWEAIEAAATKPFGFMKFTPGPGVGGHCLPIDPSYLSWRVKQSLGHQFRFVELANDVNNHMPDYTVSRIIRILNEHERAAKGSRVLLLGLAYKKNSSDARESPAVRVAELLLELGAIVDAADPHLTVPPGGLNGVKFVDTSSIDLANYEIVVLLTDHDSFDYELICRDSRAIFDTRRRVPAAMNVEFI